MHAQQDDMRKAKGHIKNFAKVHVQKDTFVLMVVIQEHNMNVAHREA
jgi:hypothetical protein